MSAPDWMDEFILELEDSVSGAKCWLRHLANPKCKDDIEISYDVSSTLKEVAEAAYQHLEECGK